ncbi:alpha/beta hydrolase family protein [Amphritea balenae]|uniref:Alpha/beta hydrolase n=1 Tax=Amphritea balenae TaxID=452629 RepID=A0A3P1SW69_9GAMM|nr:alpha/beta hydrolase [Amphritea balenae]RRD01452.1 alpha/beta hydrolase [Amphritea balenae]GGK56997.1 alpha/beta hydrolase [Amphritea balenae]
MTNTTHAVPIHTLTTHSLITKAGHSITARVFESIGENKGVVIIAPATGVAQYLYDDFAIWLTEQQFTAITFDYEGIGLSVNRHVKYSKSDKLSWATHDCAAVLDFAEQNYPDQKRTWIGHSVGGHMLGMMDNTDRIDQAITVAAGTGTWWFNAPPTRRIAWLFWYFIVPVAVPLYGYFPGKKLRFMCDMPKGVVMQWRRWCLKRDYAVGYEGEWLRQRFARVTMPITALQFSDDEMMSARNIEMLHQFFTQAPQTRLEIKPSDVGQKRIGHIGWHRARYRVLWEKYILNALQTDTEINTKSHLTANNHCSGTA